MNQEEIVREKIAQYSYYFEVRGKKAIKWEVLATKYKIPHWAFADQILSIKGLRIEADDQSLPENPYEPPLDTTQEGWRDIVDATTKRMIKDNWVKVRGK